MWVGSAAALAVLALGMLTLDDDLTTANFFRGTVEAVEGQRLLEQSFPGGASAPTVVLVRDEQERERRSRLRGTRPASRPSGRSSAVTRGRASTSRSRPIPSASARSPPSSPFRERLRAAAGPGVLVGGPTAEEADLRSATQRDTRLLVPLVLLVVLAILVLLLRSLVAPAMLMGTVVLSFLAAIGLLLLFEAFADFPGEDPSYALLSFIFLVALGVDYNIFLMARVREEATRGPTRQAMLTGLAVTGGVITSAGVVLAGTFAVLAVLPLVALTQIGVTIAFGVLLDTFVVRSVLVPALTWELGERIWWPRPPRAQQEGQRRSGRGRRGRLPRALTRAPARTRAARDARQEKRSQCEGSVWAGGSATSPEPAIRRPAPDPPDPERGRPTPPPRTPCCTSSSPEPRLRKTRRAASAKLNSWIGRDTSRPQPDSSQGRPTPRHRSSDGLGTLDLQEMTHPFDRAFLDVREGRAEEVGDLDPERAGVAPRTDRTGRWIAAACSASNVQTSSEGSSTPKKVSASLTDCATTPGIRSSSSARHASHSSPLAA